MDKVVHTELSETGSHFAGLYGIKHDSYCPIIKNTCNPKCVFHETEWFSLDGTDKFLRFDENDNLLVPDDIIEDFDIDEDVWRQCQIIDIVKGLHHLLGRSEANNDLLTLVSDMATGNLNVNVYEQNLTRFCDH